MKMTKKKALEHIKALKSGLSMVLAIVILGHTTQPLRVLAASPEESAVTTETVSAETAAEAPEAPSTVQDVLLKVCQADQDIPESQDEKCAKDLFGILMQESRGKANAVGDHGLARGWFQINRYYNPDVSIQCAEDLTCSATWTLNHLVKKGYPQASNWAIWCHNGCGLNASYVPAVRYKITKYWSDPLPVVTADEQRALALK
jgi:hypothetical protein